ncbi:hypothetical protein JOM56_001562 [Amanita muscaria]
MWAWNNHPTPQLSGSVLMRNMMFDGNRAFGRFHNILARQLEMKSLSPGALQIPSTYKARSLVSPLTLEGMCQCDDVPTPATVIDTPTIVADSASVDGIDKPLTSTARITDDVGSGTLVL